MDKRLAYTQIVLYWELVGKRSSSLDQLKKGLNTLGFLDKAKHLREVEHLLIHRNTCKTTAEYVRTKLTPEVEKLHPADDQEEKAKAFALSCLRDLIGKNSSLIYTSTKHVRINK
jgi:hypothetical protein